MLLSNSPRSPWLPTSGPCGPTQLMKDGPHLQYLLFPALFEQQGARKKFHLVVQNKWISCSFWASNYFDAQLPVLIGKGPVKLSWLKLNKDSHATALDKQILKAACPKGQSGSSLKFFKPRVHQCAFFSTPIQIIEMYEGNRSDASNLILLQISRLYVLYMHLA